MRFLFFFFSLISIGIQSGIAQSLQSAERRSDYTFIYKIHAKDAKIVHQNEMLNEYYTSDKTEKNYSAFVCKFLYNKVDSLAVGEQMEYGRLSNGHYIFVKAIKNKAKIRVFTISDYSIKIVGNAKRNWLKISSSSKTVTVPDKIVVNQKEVFIDTSLDLFNIKRVKKFKFYEIKINRDTLFYSIGNGDHSSFAENLLIGSYPVLAVGNSIRVVDNTLDLIAFGKETEKQGYILFNKPKYLPKDTVKLKILILDKRGRFYSKPVIVKLSKRYSYLDKVTIATLKPAKKGGYTHEFVLSDSLELDSRYKVTVEDRKERELLHNSFFLEDYQLNEVTYKANLPKKKFNSGDSVWIGLEAKDANGFNSLDSRAEIKIEATSVHSFYHSEVFVPKVIWKKKIKLDPLGETKVKIPNSSLGKANIELKATILFNNSNNETHEIVKQFRYQGKSRWLEAEIKRDSIFANIEPNLENQEGWVFGIKNDTIFKKKITFPYNEEVNRSLESYFFISNDEKQSVVISRFDNDFLCKTKRTQDTVLFVFYNPRKIPINYFIYNQNGKLIDKGESIELNKKIFDKSSCSYHMSCNFQYGGELIEKNYSVHQYKDQLKVEMQQPKSVVPGESVEIKLKVTDYKNKPVKDANVMANSINGQFGDIKLPKLPYLGKGKKGRSKSGNLKTYKEIKNNKFSMDSTLLGSLKLTNQLYYQFIYPGKEIKMNYDSSYNLEKPQFSPFVYQNGESEVVHLIHLDGQLIYSNELFSNSSFAFPVDTGYHTIRLRTAYRIITLDSIYMKPRCKLDFSIDLDKYKEKDKIEKVESYLSYEERIELENSTLKIGDISDLGIVYLLQGDKKIKISYLPYSYRRSVTLGPFVKGDTIQLITQDGRINTRFEFQPSFMYFFYPELIKMISYEKEARKRYLYTYADAPNEGEIYHDPKILISEPLKIQSLAPKKHRKFNPSGRFEFEVTSEKVFNFIKVSPMDSLSKSGFCNGLKRKFILEEGFYNLLLISADGLVYSKDSIKIRPNGWNYRSFNLNEFRTITIEKVIELHNLDSATVKGMNSIGSKVGESEFAIFGQVYDGETQEPLPFAQVLLEHKNEIVQGVVTDGNGKFQFSNVSDGTYFIKASFIGYNKESFFTTIKDGKSKNIDIELSSNHTLFSVASIGSDIVANRMVSLGSFESRSIRYKGKPKKKRYRYAKGFSAPRYSGSFNYYNATNLNYSDYGQFDDQLLLPMQAGNVRYDALSEAEFRFGDLNISDGMYQLSGESQVEVRKNFSDNGYWQPNLITNKNGEVIFNVKFPDNITKWKSYAVAFTENNQNGQGYTESIATKPLLAQLSTPRFFIEDDSAVLIGKISNYTKETKPILATAFLNGEIIKFKDTTIDLSLIQYLPIFCKGQDSIELRYSAIIPNSYSDIEERKVPIKRKGISENTGKFYTLRNDKNLSVELPSSNKKVIVTAYANELGPMIEVLDELKSYEYGCMEQTASKIMALLCERRINTTLGKKNSGNRKINKLIKKLEKGQNEDGSWGWWENTSSDLWMTIYVAKVLKQAQDDGFRVKNFYKVITFIKWELPELKGEKLAEALNFMSQLEGEVGFKSFFKKEKIKPQSLYEELLYIQIKQNQNISYSIKPIIDSLNTSNLGNYYWGDFNGSIHKNVNNVTSLVYQILEKHDSNHSYLNKIVDYFLETKSQNKWSNTIDKAQIVNSILPRIFGRTDNQSSSISLNIEDRVIKKFPFKTELDINDSKLSISKQGRGNLYLSIYSENWNTNPQPKDSLFKIRSFFKQSNRITDSLIAGKPTKLLVSVEVKKESEYVMIQIPIPSGCSYDNNVNVGSMIETHREYFKDKINVYCRRLTPGIYKFQINVQPRFTGSFTLNPVCVENMYFPLQQGRNGMKKTQIISNY